MYVSSVYILGILKADRYHKLEMRKDQGSDCSLWQTTVKSGEVRETVINGAPLCAISKIRFKQIKSFPLNSTPKLVKSREARLQQITPIANIDPCFL